jgi:hypothetical protein
MSERGDLKVVAEDLKALMSLRIGCQLVYGVSSIVAERGYSDCPGSLIKVRFLLPLALASCPLTSFLCRHPPFCVQRGRLSRMPPFV